jgi:hypothetical protein
MKRTRKITCKITEVTSMQSGIMDHGMRNRTQKTLLRISTIQNN